MTKILIPRSDSVSAKVIEPSDFEKLFTDDWCRDYVISGFGLSAGSGLNVTVAVGTARLKGLHLENTANETVTIPANNTSYIYLVLARVGTIYYFLHFIVVLPVVGLLEKTDPIPMSISEPVMSGGAEPSIARKVNDKV